MASRFQVFRKDRKEKERLSQSRKEEEDEPEEDELAIKPVATLTDLTRELRADQAMQSSSKKEPKGTRLVSPRMHNRSKGLTLEQSRMVFIPSLFGPDPEVKGSGQHLVPSDIEGEGEEGEAEGGEKVGVRRKGQKFRKKVRRNCCTRKCKLCLLFFGFGFLLVVGGITAFSVYHNGVEIFELPEVKTKTVVRGCRACPVYCGCGFYEIPVTSNFSS